MAGRSGGGPGSPTGLLVNDPHRRLEGVAVGAQEVAVERVQLLQLSWGVQPLVDDQTADQGPVLLLRLAVVVLVLGAGAEELDPGLPAPAQQMPVEKLAAVVRVVEPQQWEGQLEADPLQRRHDPCLTLAYHRDPLAPAGG